MVVDVLRLIEPAARRLAGKSSVKDVCYLPLYAEYQAMVGEGLKRDYIYHKLGDEYGMKPGGVRKVILRMEREV